jgi:putative phage-type endonuclease
MPITPQQREERKKWIGSSDLAPIMGCDPFRTAYDVWLEKTGRLLDSAPESESMDAGTRFEDSVLDWAQEKLGPMDRNVHLGRPDIHLQVNVDAILNVTGEPVEAKTSGLFGPLQEDWGEDDSDVVPDRVTIQTHGHMLCSSKDICHVSSFLGGRGFAMFHVPMNPDLAQLIGESCVNFWEEHVQKDIPPDDSCGSLEILKRVRRIPKKVVIVSPAIAKDLLDAKEILKVAKDAERQAQEALISAIGDAEAADFGDGEKMVTYFKQHRGQYMVQPADFRVLRFVKRKGL